MGRKSTDRARKPLTEKAKNWLRKVGPLLQDKELDKLTLDELARLMGKSKSTIYSYFATKEEIYLTVVQLVLAEMDAVISPKAAEGGDMELALRNMLLQISEGIEGISIDFLEQIKLKFPEVWSVIEAFTAMILANLKRIYTKGMEQGSFKVFNISLLTALDSHFVMNIMTNTATFSHQGMSLNDLVKEYLELRLAALKGGS